MKTRFLQWRCVVMAMILTGACARADTNEIAAAQKTLIQTRLDLQEQGFKADLLDFNFSTSPEMQARENVLINTASNRRVTPFYDHPNLMEPTADNKVIVVWQQDSLKRQNPTWPDNSYVLKWDDFCQAINQGEPQLDAACAAILSGPIQFDLDASAGNHMLLPHLALLKSLTQTFDDRAMLALHDGNRAAAWTNLLAATRLVTAWNPEPAEISHLVRFENAKQVFAAAWQVLQTNGWSDDQLARLQQEWQTADFLGSLPEIQAFKRASDAADLENDTLSPGTPEEGRYEDEQRLLFFYRDREIEYRNAVHAANWMQMQQMPGVTNELFFAPKYRYRMFSMGLYQRQMRRRFGGRFDGQGPGLFAGAAEAESERGVIITALALERYCAKYGKYPETLQALSPEFLKAVPLDFMNGQPLHYQVTGDGNFSLYSVGLDCVDNGGKVPVPPTEEERYASITNPNAPVPESDIVWPLPATSAQTVALRQQQSQALARRMAQMKAQEKVREQQMEQQEEEMRKAAMQKLLAANPSLGDEPVYQGKPLSVWVNKVGQDDYFNGPPEDAIAAIRAIGPKAVPFLLQWMPHPGAEQPVDGLPNWDGVDTAWWALGTEGKSGIPALARLISMSGQNSMDDYSVWSENAKAISFLGPDAITPMLNAAINMQGQQEFWELLHDFGNFGTNGAAAVPALIHFANSPGYMVKDGAISALGSIGQRPDLAVPFLLNALEHDSDSMVRRDAADALGAFANDSDAVLPLLIKTVKDSGDWETRAGAISGLGKIQNKADVIVPVIVPYLNDNNSVLDRYTAYALSDLGSDGAYNALLQATNNPNIGDIVYQAREKVHAEH